MFKTNKINLKSIIITLIPLIGSLLISFIIKDSYKLYGEIQRPSFAPPSIIFAIVWPILYILMGVSSNIINEKKEKSLFVFYLQLMLNYLWPILFFVFRLYGIAFIELIILFIFIIITFMKFIKINKIAGVLLIPYILWTLYAIYLNYMVWMYNEM